MSIYMYVFCHRISYQTAKIKHTSTGNKLEGDEGDLQAQSSPYLQLREKLKCIEHT